MSKAGIVLCLLFVLLVSCAQKRVPDQSDVFLDPESEKLNEDPVVKKDEESFKQAFEEKELSPEDIDYFDHEKELTEGLPDKKSPTEFDIPIVINKKVEKWLSYFQDKGRKFFNRWLKRSGKYIPMMQKILKENGLPEDLVYLAMIESGFKPYAYSRAAAVGPWQFMRRTGQRYGLKANWVIDERRDPEKSTIAAAQHLKDLYDQFDHWYLAAASYNAGAGKISRAIKRYSTEDFWEMSKYRYLRSETKNYVPKMIAAAMIAKNPEKYGFKNIEYESPLEYDRVIVPKPTDLKSIANVIGTDYKTLKNLNPELLRWFTPPKYPNYELKIPKGLTQKFEENRNKFKDVMISGVIKHRLRYGETLSHVARNYGTSVRALMSFNNISNTRRIRSGKIIRVPIRKGTQTKSFTYASATPGKHKIRRGETLTHLAKAYNVAVKDLMAANAISNPRSIKAGQTLSIPGRTASGSTSVTKTHKLRRGETLSHVADLYKTSIASLISLNNIRNPRRLRAGQNIKVPANARRISKYSGIDAKIYKEKLNEKGAIGYTVKSGDTLWSISRAFNVTVREIRNWNNLGSSRVIHPGKKLVIYPRFIGNGNGNSKKYSDNTMLKVAKFHRVRSGDTLWDISRTYKIPMSDLLALNNFQKDIIRIKPGDIIKLTN